MDGAALTVVFVAGPDDYPGARSVVNAGTTNVMIRPWHDHQLAVYAEAAKRAPVEARPQVLQFGALRVELRRKMALAEGTPIPLRRAEWRLLAYLGRNAGRVVPPEEILLKVLGARAGDGGSARNQVYELRKKLEAAGFPDLIETVHGEGYGIGLTTNESILAREGMARSTARNSPRVSAHRTNQGANLQVECP